MVIPTTSGASHATASGLEGVVVAETRLSNVEGNLGRLTLVGHSLESLVARARFEEVAALLWCGRPATPAEMVRVDRALGAARQRAHALVGAQPSLLFGLDCMSALRARVAAFVPGDLDSQLPPEIEHAVQLTGFVGVATAHWVRTVSGGPLLDPDPGAGHAADLLRLMHSRAPTPAAARALDVYLMAVIDHGLNASTFTARVVTSTGSDVVSAVTAAIGALKGPLHGGAPGPVLDMLDAIGNANRARDWLERELDAGRRIMGMGHRVYRVRDPRARVLETALEGLAHDTPRLEARIHLARAVEAEAEALLEARAPNRALKANVEFFTAVLLDALEIPREAFTGVFAAGRVAGWCAHVHEQRAHNRLVRPASRYVGPAPA